MSSELDFLIPSELLPLIHEDKFDLEIKLQGFNYQNIAPKIKIKLNGKLLIDNKVENSYTFNYSTKVVPGNSYSLELNLYNKLDNFTSVDVHNNITENLGIEIKSIIINDIDIVATNLIFNLGEFTPKLSDKKKQFFIENNIPIGPTKSLGIFENGTWRMNFVAPVLRHLNQFTAFFERHEIWPRNDLLKELYDTINRIRHLEEQIQSNK